MSTTTTQNPAAAETGSWRELMPFESHWAQIGSHRMHYIDEGPVDAPVLLCVHGNPSWSFYWRSVVAKLRDSYRVIAFDHIGCGLSDKPDDAHYPYTLARRIDDMTALVEQLGLRKLSLAVHDWGGMIGMGFAVGNVDKIEALLVLNTGAFPLPASKRFPWTIAMARLPGVSALLVRGGNAFSRGAVRYCVTRAPMSRQVAAGYLAPYSSWKDRVAVHRFVQDIPLRPTDPAWPSLERTQQALPRLANKPMAIWWGMQDFVFDHHFLAEWRTRFPEAQVTTYEDAGHYVLEDAGNEIVPAMRKFLDAHVGSAKASSSAS